jgi:hypothetical protein
MPSRTRRENFATARALHARPMGDVIAGSKWWLRRESGCDERSWMPRAMNLLDLRRQRGRPRPHGDHMLLSQTRSRSMRTVPIGGHAEGGCSNGSVGMGVGPLNARGRWKKSLGRALEPPVRRSTFGSPPAVRHMSKMTMRSPNQRFVDRRLESHRGHLSVLSSTVLANAADNVHNLPTPVMTEEVNTHVSCSLRKEK